MEPLEKIVARAQKGDRAAIESLLSSHRQAVLALALTFLKDRGLAEEAAQEAFIRVFSRLDTLKKPARFRSWCLTITANICRDRLRQKRPQTVSLEQAPEPASEPAPASNQRLTEGLARLSDGLRRCLLWRDVEGFSYDEIADIEKIPVGTVKSRIFEARRKLRKWMTACDVTKL